MGRSRYTITEPQTAHFVTCTIIDWLPLFSSPEVVQIIFDSWSFLRNEGDFKLYGFVVLENHLHFIAQSDDLTRSVSRFKSYTARQIIDGYIAQKAYGILDRLAFGKKQHKHDRDHQFWQEGSHPELIQSDVVMREKLEYIHNNPAKRGYVDLAEHWRYSSARCYQGEDGLIELDIWS